MQTCQDELNFFENWKVVCGVPVFMIKQADGQKLLEGEQNVPSWGFKAAAKELLVTQSIDTVDIIQWISSHAYDHQIDATKYLDSDGYFCYPGKESSGRTGDVAEWFEVWSDKGGVHNVRMKTKNGKRWSAQENVNTYPPRGWAAWDVKRINLKGDVVNRIEISKNLRQNTICRIRVWTKNGYFVDSESSLEGDSGFNRYYNMNKDKEDDTNLQVLTWSKDAKNAHGVFCPYLPGSGCLSGMIARLQDVRVQGNLYEKAYLSFLAFGFQSQCEEFPYKSQLSGEKYFSNYEDISANISADGKYIITYAQGCKYFTVWDVNFTQPIKILYMPSKYTSRLQVQGYFFSEDGKWVLGWVERWLYQWSLSGEYQVVEPVYQVSSPLIHQIPIGCSMNNDGLVCACSNDRSVNVTVWEFCSMCPRILVAATVANPQKNPFMLETELFTSGRDHHLDLQTSIYGFHLETKNGMVLLQNGYAVVIWRWKEGGPVQLDIKMSLDMCIKSSSLSECGVYLCLVVYRKGLPYIQIWHLQTQTPTQIQEFLQNRDYFESWDCQFNQVEQYPQVACWSTGSDKLIRIFNIKEQGDVLIMAQGKIRSLCWTAKTDKLVTLHRGTQGSADVVHIWDSRNGVCLLQLEPHQCGINPDTCIVSADGSRILTWRQKWQPKRQQDPFENTLSQGFSQTKLIRRQVNLDNNESINENYEPRYPPDLLINFNSSSTEFERQGGEQKSPFIIQGTSDTGQFLKNRGPEISAQPEIQKKNKQVKFQIGEDLDGDKLGDDKDDDDTNFQITKRANFSSDTQKSVSFVKLDERRSLETDNNISSIASSSENNNNDNIYGKKESKIKLLNIGGELEEQEEMNNQLFVVWQPEYILKSVQEPWLMKSQKQGSYILGASFSNDNQYLFCIAHGGVHQENMISMSLKRISPKEVMWNKSLVSSLGEQLRNPLAKSNVKIQFSDDDSLVMVVLRVGKFMKMIVRQTIDGEISLETDLQDLTQINGKTTTTEGGEQEIPQPPTCKRQSISLPILKQKGNAEISLELLAAQCIEASSLVGIEQEGFAALLCTPSTTFVWGLGARKSGPFLLNHDDPTDRLVSAATQLSNEGLKIITCSEKGLVFFWILHVKRAVQSYLHIFQQLVIKAMSANAVVEQPLAPYDQVQKTGAVGLNTYTSQPLELEFKDRGNAPTNVQYFYEVDDVKMQSQLLPKSNLENVAHCAISASGSHIIACSINGQVSIWYEMNAKKHIWVALICAFTTQLGSLISPNSSVLSVWSSMYMSRWSLLYMVANQTGSIGSEIKMYVLSGYFTGRAGQQNGKVSCSMIGNSSLDLSDVIHGFPRIGTLGLPSEKLALYKNGKIIVYHLTSIANRIQEIESDPSYIECQIPHDYRQQISSCQFSPNGKLIVCGTFSGDIIVINCESVFGRLSSINYHNMLMEVKMESDPTVGTKKSVVDVDKKAISQEFFRQHLKQSGISMLTAVNMPDDKGNSLMMYLAVDRNQLLLAYIFKWAAKFGAWLDLNLAAEGDTWGEAIRGQASSRPPPLEEYRGACIKLLIENMMIFDDEHGWIVSPRATANVMPQLFTYLVTYFPALLIWLVKQANFTPEIEVLSRMPIPQLFASLPITESVRMVVGEHGFMTHWKPQVFWNHIASYDQFVKEDENSVDEEKIMQQSHKYEHKFKLQKSSQENFENPADAQVLLFQGAAKGAMAGLIGPLINAPHVIDEAFTSPAVISIIRLKWMQFGRRVLLFEIILYCVLIFSFIQFVLLDVPYQGIPTTHLTIHDTFKEARFCITTILSFVNIFISLGLNYWKYGPFYINFFKDCWQIFQAQKMDFTNVKQTKTNFQIVALIEVFVISAISIIQLAFLATYDKVFLIVICTMLAVRLSINETMQLRQKGFLIWVRSGWNLFDVISYVLLYVIFIYEVSGHSEQLAQSVLISIEAIFLWPKIMSYLRAFRETGPTIQMIIEVFKDTAFFLVLLMIIAVGFSAAFFSLFGTEEVLYADEDFGKVDFVRILPTLLAVIAFMAGDFEQSTFTSGPVWWWSMTMFVIFFFLNIIVLLNLLIALLGDSYNKIKQNEQARFMRGRAEILDDLESSLFLLEAQKWENGYVQILVPKQALDSSVKDTSGEEAWEGSVNQTLAAIKNLPERIIANLLKFLGVGVSRDWKKHGSVKLKATGGNSLFDKVKHIEDDISEVKDLVNQLQQTIMLQSKNGDMANKLQSTMELQQQHTDLMQELQQTILLQQKQLESATSTQHI